MICPVCSAQITDNAAFCNSCGFKFVSGAMSFQVSTTYEKKEVLNSPSFSSNATQPIESSASPEQYSSQKRNSLSSAIQTQEESLKEPIIPRPSQIDSPSKPTPSLDFSSIHQPIIKTLRRGRYKVIKELGKGGMGKVYLVEDTLMKCKIVIKELLPFYTTQDEKKYAEKRFMEEARLLFNLKLNNLPKVADCFMENDSLFLIMEYVEGKNLEKITEERSNNQITVDECLKWMTVILEILKYLQNHKPPIIHRDIKPENIMMTKNEDIYLVDFGIARNIGVGTTTYTTAGTPYFASPEHFTGKHSISSDIYSLGAPSSRKMFTFPPLSKYRNDVPEGLQKIVDTMLANKKEFRYQTAEEVLDDLNDIANKEENQFFPLSALKSRNIKNIIRRLSINLIKTLKLSFNISKKLIVFLILLLGFLSLMGLFFLLIGAFLPSKTEPDISPTSEIRSGSTQPPPSISPRPSVSFGEWGCITTLDVKSPVYTVAYSPDGKYIVSGGKDSKIRVWDINKVKNVRVLSGHTSGVFSAAFARKGKIIISGSADKTVKIWDIETRQCLKTLKGHSDQVNSVSVSPDDKYAASGSYDNAVKIWDIHSGRCLITLRGHSEEVSSVVFSPDGKKLASGGHDFSIKIWNVNSGSIFLTLKRSDEKCCSLAYSPDGKNIASGSRDNISIWNSNTGENLSTFTFSPIIKSLVFSHDGKYIASGWEDDALRIFDVSKKECLRTLTGHKDTILSVAFSPDGNNIATGSNDGKIKIWGAKGE